MLSTFNNDRWLLVPKEVPGVFFHKNSTSLNTFDSVSLPHHLNNYKINHDAQIFKNTILFRFKFNESIKLQYEKFINYEVEDIKADSIINNNRFQIDSLIEYSHISELNITNADLLLIVANFQYLVDNIFKYTLCSMERIVISCRSHKFSDLIITTSRDSEKEILTINDIMIYKDSYDKNTVKIYCNDFTKKVSSSILSSIEFFKRIKFGFLVHIHAIFPVLLNEKFKSCYIVKEAPRKKEFGIELSNAFSNNYKYILRQNEGIWCFKETKEDVMQDLINCQYKAVKELMR